MMPFMPELAPFAAEAQIVGSAQVAGPIFFGILVATAWFTVFGFLASWMLDRSNRHHAA